MDPVRFFRALAQWLSLPLLLVVLIAMLWSGGAFAQAVPATAPIPRVAFPLTQVGNVTTFGAKTADAANAANFSFGVAANGAVFATAPSEMPTAGGKSVLVNVGGAIPKANVMAALGRFAKKALPIVSTGFALYDLGNELGFGLDNSSGTMQFSKSNPLPAGYDGNEYTVDQIMMWRDTKQLACEDFASYRTAGQPYNNYRCVGVSGIYATHQYQPKSAPNGPWYTDNSFQLYSRVDPTPPSTAPLPSTEAEFVEALNARTSWPESSALARATVDAINSGESLAVQPSAVTGPASVPAGSSQSVDAVAGTTTNHTTTNNYSYAGSQVTTNVVTTSVTTNSSGAVVTNVTTNVSPNLADLPKPLEFPCGGPGLPACAVKVDESGVPSTVTMSDPFPNMQAQQTEKLNQIKAADGTAWEPIKDLFFLPAATQCVPFAMPVVMGTQVPSIDPCPVVGGIQQVVGVLWYIAGFWIMLGWVREVV